MTVKTWNTLTGKFNAALNNPKQWLLGPEIQYMNNLRQKYSGEQDQN